MNQTHHSETPAVEATAPPRNVPCLALGNAHVDEDRVVLTFHLSGPLSDPRRIIHSMLCNELDRWKQTAPEWQRFAPFAARLEEAARDLAEAEAAALAAKQAWQEAIRAGGDAAPLERNRIDADTKVAIVKERAAALKAVEAEREAEVESAWRKRIQEVVSERRARSEAICRDAKDHIVRTVGGLAILTISEEVRLALQLALGSNGLFGLSPRLFD